MVYRPKWRSSAFLSQQLTARLADIRHYETRRQELSETFGTKVESHPDAWLLDAPRCVFTQGFLDYQTSLSETFKAIKSGKAKHKASSKKGTSGETSPSSKKCLPDSFTRGNPSDSSQGVASSRRFPTFYSLYDQQTARFQIDKPTKNKKHLETWAKGKIRLGDLVLRYKDPTKLPAKLPSLVTVIRNQAGQYFAAFLTEEIRSYKKPVAQEKLAIRHNHRQTEINLARSENRALGCDPNIRAEYFADTQGLVFSIAERQTIKNNQERLESKQLAAARHLAKTRRYERVPKTPASNRHQKARQALAKIHLDRRNQHEDFIQKKTSVLATFYPRQARESLDVSQMIQKNGAVQAPVQGLTAAQVKRFGVAKGMSRATFGRQRSLLKEKLEAYHPAHHKLITLKKYERSTQCCSKCHEERITVARDIKNWTCPYCKTEHNRDTCAAQNTCAKGFGLAPLSASKPKTLSPKEVSSLKSAGYSFDPKTGFPLTGVHKLHGAGQRRTRFVTVESHAVPKGDCFELRVLRRLQRFSAVQLFPEDLKRLRCSV